MYRLVHLLQLSFGYFLLALIASSCSSNIEQSIAPKEIQAIELSHNKTIFLNHEAVKFNLHLTFNKHERLNGVITLLTDNTKGKIELANGNNIYFSGDSVYYSPSIKDDKGIRFDAYTWAYFFSIAYKLSDPGTIWSNFKQDSLANNLYNSQKLSFKPGIGDDPEDWYIFYTSPQTSRIEYVAYIVSAHGGKEAAELDPHAIQYSDYQTINQIPIATTWTFWTWRPEAGITKELGQGKVSNVEFIKVKNDTFIAPEEYSLSLPSKK